MTEAAVFTDASCIEVEKWLRKVKAFIAKRKKNAILAVFPTGIVTLFVCSDEGGENAD